MLCSFARYDLYQHGNVLFVCPLRILICVRKICDLGYVTHSDLLLRALSHMLLLVMPRVLKNSEKGMPQINRWTLLCLLMFLNLFHAQKERSNLLCHSVEQKVVTQWLACFFFLFVAHVSYACCINQRRGTSPSLECHMKHLNHRVSGRLNRHIKVGSPEVSKTLNFFYPGEVCVVMSNLNLFDFFSEIFWMKNNNESSKCSCYILALEHLCNFLLWNLNDVIYLYRKLTFA